MVWIKRVLLLVVVTGLGFLAWSYVAGGLKMKRDYWDFAEAMESCTPLQQSWTFKGHPFSRSVKGVESETCVIDMSTPSPQMLECKFAMAEMPVLAESFARQAENIDLIGMARLHIDINSDDPYFVALNSDACRLVDPA